VSSEDIAKGTRGSGAAVMFFDQARGLVKTADEVRDILGEVALHADSSIADCVRVVEQALPDPRPPTPDPRPPTPDPRQ
jgi:hypothetical protein